MRLVGRIARLEALGGPGDPDPLAALTDDELLGRIEDILGFERGVVPRDVRVDLAAWNWRRGYVDRDDLERWPAECVMDTVYILAAEAWGCPRAEARAAFEQRFDKVRRW